MLALDTLVNDDGFVAFLLRANGFHQPAAVRRPIAGIYVHMLAPQAVRAVVGVSVAGNGFAAPFTREVLSTALEFA